MSESTESPVLDEFETDTDNVIPEAEPDPVMDSDQAESETVVVLPEDDLLDDNAAASTEASVVYVEVPAESDISFNVSAIFVLSMILGVFIFSILSRRWYV